MRNWMKYFWFFSPTQLLIQGQWWSILRMQCLHILQWWALGGRYISHLTGRLYRNLTWGFMAHLVQIVQSSFGAMLPPSLWLSEKSILWLGRGTIPGSEKTARACAMKSKKMTMLNMTTWKLPHRLPDMVCRTIHLQSSNNQFVVIK